MKLTRITLPLALAVAMATGGSALAQPQTKLMTGVDKATIQAIWCSALLLEESYWYEEGTDEAIRYENLAYDLGLELDDILAENFGLREAEVEEVWQIFDDEAYALAEENGAAFDAQLQACETNYETLLP